MEPMTLYPYKKPGDKNWVFDDERAGLKEEAFVLGMSEMISQTLLLKKIQNASAGFAMTFSDKPFDHDVVLVWDRNQDVILDENGNKNRMAGDWYSGYIGRKFMSGWLCPALLLYFKDAPAKLYVKAEPLPVGVDPIWHDYQDVGRKFVGSQK